MSKDTAKIWLGRFPVLHEDHLPDLEARAAVHEFKHKLPRDVAEDKAHQDYMKDQALEAAAHHLLGIRAAHAAGHDEAAQQHGEAYAGALKHAGFDPMQTPPQEVLDRVKAARPKVYSFKAHAADQLFTPQPSEADAADQHIRQLLDKLQQLRSGLNK